MRKKFFKARAWVRRVLGVLGVAAVVGVTGCPNPTDEEKPNSGLAAGVDWTNYATDYAFRVRNLTSENLVVFKNSVSTATCIGGLPAGPDTVQGFKNDSAKFGTNTGDFVLIFIKNEDYEAKQSSPSLLAALGQQPFARIWGYHNGSGENDQIFEVSGYLGGAGTIVLQNDTNMNLELRLDSPTGESIGFAKAGQTGGITLHMTAPHDYIVYPVFKKYDSVHNRIITVKPTFPENHDDELLAGMPYREFFALDTTQSHVISAKTFQDKLSTFTTGSAYLMVENQSGHGVQILKGSILVNTEMDTSALNNMDTRTFTIDMAKVGSNSYAETADVRQFQMGMPGSFRPLQGNLVDGSGAAVSDDNLTLSVDYMYKITILTSGKYRWDGQQGDRVSLDDLEEDEE